MRPQGRGTAHFLLHPPQGVQGGGGGGSAICAFPERSSHSPGSCMFGNHGFRHRGGFSELTGFDAPP